MRPLLVLLFLLLGSETAFSLPDSFTGTVIEVSEGDTLSVLHKGKLVDIRLAFIDCPERAQSYGREAAEFTAMMAEAGPVRIEVRSISSLGKVNAEVILMDAGLNINQELVKAGFAWLQREYRDNPHYNELERLAREMKVGLWKQVNPTPPWDFKDKRHGQ